MRWYEAEYPCGSTQASVCGFIRKEEIKPIKASATYTTGKCPYRLQRPFKYAVNNSLSFTDNTRYELIMSCSASDRLSILIGFSSYSKNVLRLMPKPLQILSRVGIDGTVFRLKILLRLPYGISASFASLYKLQCLYSRKYLILLITSSSTTYVSPSLYFNIVI